MTFLPNPTADTCIPVTVNGQPWVVERTWRLIARPADSKLCLVVAEDLDHLYYPDAVAVERIVGMTVPDLPEMVESGVIVTDLHWAYSTGQGQLLGDFQDGVVPNIDWAELSEDFDAPAPQPVIVPLPMTVAPFTRPLSVGWYYAFHHPEWNHAGAPFPDIDPRLPCDYIWALSDDEIRYAVSQGMPIIVLDRPAAERAMVEAARWPELWAKPSDCLWAFGCRNEIDIDLQAALDALEPLCVEFDKTACVYNDRTFDKWPKRWPSFAVAEIPVFHDFHEAPTAFKARGQGIIDTFTTAFPDVPHAVCASGFDRNLPKWLKHELGNLQVTFFEWMRETQALGVVVFDWGRHRADLDIGGAFWHPDIAARWIEAGKARQAGASQWPRPSDFSQGDDDMVKELAAYAAVRDDLTQACMYTDRHGDARLEQIEFQSRRFAGGFPGETWTRDQVVAEVLKAKYPAVTPAACAGQSVAAIVKAQVG